MDEYLLRHNSVELKMPLTNLLFLTSMYLLAIRSCLYLSKGFAIPQPVCSIFLALLTNVALLSNPSSKRIRTASNPSCNVKFNWKISLWTFRTSMCCKSVVSSNFKMRKKKYIYIYLFSLLFSERAKNKRYRIHFTGRSSNS